MQCLGIERGIRSRSVKKKVVAKPASGAPPVVIQEWTGWRGPNRDGRVAWLPERLPTQIKPCWTIDTSSRGLGGVAATKEYVIFSDRGLNDTIDEWKCVHADTGKEVWTYSYPCQGNLDYGNSPRATPLIVGEFVYLFGAFGHLACLKLKSGDSVWELNLRDEFDATDKPQWGACSSPLIADGKLIVNPGTSKASLAALDPKTGKTIWKSPGKSAGYGSLISGTFGGKLQIVGHDSSTIGGWDPVTGKRLWTVKPDSANDFNVPTPINWNGKLLITTENNGTRIFQFNDEGLIQQKPIAINKKLAPDTHSPVLVGDRLFGIWRRLYCLDTANQLKPLWEVDDSSYSRYSALVATDHRVLAVTLEGQFILFENSQKEFKELGRVSVLPGEKGLYSHPAFVGTRVYVRGSSVVSCVDFAD